MATQQHLAMCTGCWPTFSNCIHDDAPGLRLIFGPWVPADAILQELEDLGTAISRVKHLVHLGQGVDLLTQQLAPTGPATRGQPRVLASLAMRWQLPSVACYGLAPGGMKC